MAHAVREERFDALVLRDVVHDAEQAGLLGPVLGHPHDIDVERPPAIFERHFERDRFAVDARSRERGDVRHEHTGGEDSPQVVAEVGVELEPEQRAVARVGVHEPEYLVGTDADDERRLRQGIEHHANVARASPWLRPIHRCLPQRVLPDLSAAKADLNAVSNRPRRTRPVTWIHDLSRLRGDNRRRGPVLPGMRPTPGASLEERRLATVLMADLVGFTTISAGADPEHIKRLVDHCFERLVADITEFGGRLDKIVGDEIIAIFGAPIAHEDDAERAVRAALRMQETMQTVASEVGIPVQVGSA